ncbi:MAG: hypothetical protein WBP71_08845 [Terracidiphilus sp.]
MRRRIFALCALFAGFATMAQAQANFSINCPPPLVTQEITKTWTVDTFLCTTDGAISGVAFKGLTLSRTLQYGPTEDNVWGVMVGALANGDQVFFDYHTVFPVKNGVAGNGTLTYKMVGGTGLANGITGSGTCKVVSTSGGAQDACVGAYATR